MEKDRATCMIYNTDDFNSILKDVTVCPYMNLQDNIITSFPVADPSLVVPLDDLCVSDTLFCSYCNIGFLDKEQQRAHYKLDWHRYNLKQHLVNKKTISEDRFSQLVEDDVSSISGSESPSDTEPEKDERALAREAEYRLSHLIARRSRILFNNSEGKVISIHRCLLLHKKEKAVSDDHLVQLIKKLPQKTNWMIVMLGGGHFAAAIFKGEEIILHKTLHKYTVRAKQGGSQGAKDNKGSHAKSAGANLRRLNEQSLANDINELFTSWGPEINKCSLIFHRAVGKGNHSILFSSSSSLSYKGDPRLRKMPFSTNRATFNEIKRAHQLLSTVYVYDSNEMFKTTFSPPKMIREDSEEKKWKKEGNGNDSNCGSPRKIDRGKERPSPVRELPEIVQQLAAISTSGSEGDLAFVMDDEELSFEGLREYEDTVPQSVKDRVNRKKSKKKKKPDIKPKEAMKPEIERFYSSVHSACQSNDDKLLKLALEGECRTELTQDEISKVLNQPNIAGETILHNAAAEGKSDAVRLLLLNGADPCIKDKKSKTPFDHSADKNLRNVFMRFRGEYPEMYDYTKSHIPMALTEELEAEIAEKRKMARKNKRLKDKERKLEKDEKKKEEQEKNRFLNLSDREKMALAAEKRILAAPGNKNLVLCRCYTCANDMTGKVPFEYETFRFCSMPCLKAHRVKGKKL